MRKVLCLALITIIVCFNGCSKFESNEKSKKPISSSESSDVSSTVEHSKFYIAGVDVEDVIRYFNEVVLNAEYVFSGDATVVQKWENEVVYCIYGNPTSQDIQMVESTVMWLNSINGFPKMTKVENEEDANLQIHFADHETMISMFGEQHINNDGAVSFWYENNKIYRGVICVRTDIDQYTRNSVIIEEIYNGMGPIQDTDLRLDSIIYSGFSTPQKATDIDKLIMTLLYHPAIECGMTAEECEAVIRKLYY